MVELVIFDWSGTVVDDRRIVYDTVAKLLKQHDKELMPFDEWVSFVSASDSSLVLSEVVLNKYGIGHDPLELNRNYMSALNEVANDGTKSLSYPDALEVLSHIASNGKKIAVVSFQPTDHILKEAADNGLDKFITRIAGNAFDKSEHILYLCKEMGVEPSNAIFVGDMVGDIKSAKMAGVKSAAITTGYHSREILMTAKPDYVISNLTELKDII